MNSLITYIKNNKLKALISVTMIISLVPYMVNEIFDLDIWWHLVIGRDILSSWSIPFFDKFTVAGFGRPYHDSHWLFQVIAVLSENCCGVVGVQLMEISILGLTIFFIWKSSSKWSNSVYVPLIVFISAMAASERFLHRPEIITFLMISVFYYLLQNKNYFNKTHIILFAILQIIWSNSHGLFIIGPFMIGCYFLIDIINYLRKSDNTLKQTGILLAVVVLSTFIAPWGFNGWYYSFIIFSEAAAKTSEVIKNVGEMSPTFGAASRSGYAFWFYIVAMLMVIFSSFTMFRFKQFLSARFLIVVGILLASFTGRRNIALFAMVAAPFILEFIGKNEVTSSSKLKYFKYILPFIFIFWAWFGFSNTYYMKTQLPTRFGFGYSKVLFPYQMMDFLKKINFKGNVFESNAIGGYYLYNNYPNALPLSDGRWEIYDPDVINTIQDAAFDQILMQKVLNKYNIRAYILVHSSREAKGLLPVLRQNTDWKLVYYDYNVSIWLRRDDPLYFSVPERRVGTIILPPSDRVQNYIMMELFLEGVKSTRYRIFNIDKLVAFNWYPEYFLEQKARIYMELGNAQDAEATYRTLLKYDPKSELAMNELAYFEYTRGNLKEAENLIHKILNINPNNDKARANLKIINDNKKK